MPSGVVISPKNPTLAAGSLVTFNATASDVYGNSWDVTSLTTWSIDSGAGGSWNANAYTCGKTGIWTVSATYNRSLYGTTTLTVGYANAFTISISPKNPNVTAGQSVTFDATATDMYGNSWDVTHSTVWNITSNAFGSWSNNIYTSSMAGTWTVTATYKGIYDTTTLTVNHGFRC